MALLPIMRQLAVDMAALQNALFMEDFEEVEARAESIAHHPHISPAEIARIQSELGSDMEEFEELDVAVHDASVRMYEASRGDDIDAVLGALADVQSGCVACHERFRERLRTTQ